MYSVHFLTYQFLHGMNVIFQENMLNTHAVSKHFSEPNLKLGLFLYIRETMKSQTDENLLRTSVFLHKKICTENFFVPFKKGVFWHVKPFKISV